MMRKKEATNAVQEAAPWYGNRAKEASPKNVYIKEKRVSEDTKGCRQATSKIRNVTMAIPPTSARMVIFIMIVCKAPDMPELW